MRAMPRTTVSVMATSTLRRRRRAIVAVRSRSPSAEKSPPSRPRRHLRLDLVLASDTRSDSDRTPPRASADATDGFSMSSARSRSTTTNARRCSRCYCSLVRAARSCPDPSFDALVHSRSHRQTTPCDGPRQPFSAYDCRPFAQISDLVHLVAPRRNDSLRGSITHPWLSSATSARYRTAFTDQGVRAELGRWPPRRPQPPPGRRRWHNALVSFDLVVWDSDDPMTDEQASAYVRSIYDQADADPAEHIDDPSGRILSFFAECTNRWPGESETSPWASWPIELTMPAVASINLQWSTPEARSRCCFL